MLTPSELRRREAARDLNLDCSADELADRRRVREQDRAWRESVRRHHRWQDLSPASNAKLAEWQARRLDAACEESFAERRRDQESLRDAAQAEWLAFNGVATAEQVAAWKGKFQNLTCAFRTELKPVTIIPFPAAALAAQGPALPLIYFGECRNAPPARYHVKGVLAEGATSSLYGAPKSLKSTLAVDIGVHLASGREWRGRRVRERRGVVYFAFERAAQVRKALAAYAIRDGLADLPFAVVPRLVDMINPACVDLVVATIRAAEARFGCPVGFAVFDTWNKGIAAGGGSEDKAEHQNMAAANLRRIIEALPSLHCMTVGHTGKDATKGERGSNATMGDRDVGILIEGTERVRKVSIAYANDLPDGELTAFEGEQIVVGVDDDGEPVTAFIVSPRLVTLAPTRKVSTRQDLAMNALERTARDHGREPPAGSDIPMHIRVVTLDSWRDELFRSGVLDRNAANPREPFRRLKRDLIAADLIIERDGFVWPMQPGGINLPPFPMPST